MQLEAASCFCNQPLFSAAPIYRTRDSPLSFQSIMTLPASALPAEAPTAFLGVAHSLTGKLWRDRRDARGADPLGSIRPTGYGPTGLRIGSAPKGRFAEPIQRDLPCPVPSSKRILFSADPNQF